uniref:ZCCT1 n=1 Tax=Triticum monococcum TaxID=4568 RepID=Q6RY79_TRIMO|nr:ZCCT1 [Triticum monococcum]
MSMSCGSCGANNCPRLMVSPIHHHHHHHQEHQLCEYQFFAHGNHHHHHGSAADYPVPPPPDNFDHRRTWTRPFHETAAAGNSSRLTLEVGAGGQHMAHLVQPPARAHIVPFHGGAFTNTISNEAIMTIDTEMMVGPAHYPTMQERAAKVMRYREKRKRRRYDKQIRYESRKAYAELRPRVNGRFVKVPEAMASPSSPASPYDPSKLHLGWFR